MKALVQRVSRAAVRNGDNEESSIGPGLCCLIGIHKSDTPGAGEYLMRKILNLRIFNDSQGIMNKSLMETGGELLLVSQFTLYGDTKKGNRPSYQDAMPPEEARIFFHEFIQKFAAQFPSVKTGFFGEHMEIDLVNNGPVTILIESP